VIIGPAATASSSSVEQQTGHDTVHTTTTTATEIAATTAAAAAAAASIQQQDTAVEPDSQNTHVTAGERSADGGAKGGAAENQHQHINQEEGITIINIFYLK
jgi:hypothetical protein